jgi:hypothetical protein
VADQLALIAELSKDRALASAMLFEHRHSHETAPYHIELLDLWGSSDEFMSFEAFREGGKSTLCEESVIMEACFGNFNYCMIVGETYKKACARLEGIKYEIRHNDKIRKIFGKLEGKPWNENEIVLDDRIRIEAIGWDQEIRSYLWRNHRPDRCMIDDVENRIMVRDSDTVKANWDRMFGELIPAMDVNVRLRAIGTPLAADCMIVRMRNSKFWRSFQYPICDGDIDDEKTQATWPSRYPMEWVRKRRDFYQSEGQLKKFYQEYMLVPHTSNVRPFEVESLTDGTSARFRGLAKYVQYDPARTANIERSARTGKVVVSFAGSKIVCHQSSGHFWMPDEIQGDIIETTREHRPLWVGVEKNSLDEWLLQPLRAKMLSTATFVPLVPMNAPQDQDKDSFIMSLQPFIAAGDLVLVGGLNAHPDLVEEIRNFPTGKKDVINALALSMRLKPGLAVYPDFGPENIIEHFTPHPILSWHLVANATGSENCFALMQIDGLHMHVFRDWVLPGTPDDAIKRMSADIRLYYPKADKIEVWAPSDAHDNWARSQLIPALRRFKTTASRGEYVARSRGALTDLIRTSAGDHRLLTCSPEAWQTINALSGGYCAQLRPDGRVSDQPVANHYKTLAEAIESLAAFINQGIGSLTEIPGARYAVSSDGRKYISSLPERRPR